MMITFNDFIAWEATTRDTIDFKTAYVDMTGDLIAGLLLSQIVYWHLPNRRGESKLRVNKDGRTWLVKKRTDWWDEIRITPCQVDRALKVLEDKGLVETALFRFAGSPTKHIRLDQEKFLTVFQETVKSNLALAELEVEESATPCTETPTETPAEYCAPAQHTPDTPSEGSPLEGDALLDAFGLQGPDWARRGGSVEPGHWLEHVQGCPWLQWGDGHLSERAGVSEEAQKRIGYILEDVTGMVPLDNEWDGFANFAVAVYKAARGNWDAVRAGFELAWSYDDAHKPATIAIREGQDSGFVRAVRKARAIAESRDEGQGAGIAAAFDWGSES